MQSLLDITGMTHALNSDRWLGYATLICVVLTVVMPRCAFLPEDMRFALAASVAVLGLYCGLRGVLLGRWLSRACAGVSLVFWVWLLYSLMLAFRSVRIK